DGEWVDGSQCGFTSAYRVSGGATGTIQAHHERPLEGDVRHVHHQRKVLEACGRGTGGSTVLVARDHDGDAAGGRDELVPRQPAGPGRAQGVPDPAGVTAIIRLVRRAS